MAQEEKPYKGRLIWSRVWSIDCWCHFQ